MLNSIQNWSETTVTSLQNLWQGTLAFLPNLIGALIVFIVGWFVALAIGGLVSGILKKAQLDKIFEKTKWNEALSKADLKMTISSFLGVIVKWIIIIVFLSAAVEILGATQFSYTLGRLIDWLPSLLVAVVIFVVAAIIADLAEKLVKVAVGKMDIKQVNCIGLIVRYSIWVIAIFAILSELGVAKDVVNVLMTGLVALLVLSGSIAFGLGGKDAAKEMIDNIKKKLKD